MLRKLKNYFSHLNRKSCPECGCRETSEVTTDFTANVVCEARIVCRSCWTDVNYFAYGHLESPQTYTASFNLWLVEMYEQYRRKRFGKNFK